ncbi:hypothetical protein [Kiloniella majae]|nr:hypothetical protein [Kiloniella majae]
MLILVTPSMHRFDARFCSFARGYDLERLLEATLLALFSCVPK